MLVDFPGIFKNFVFEFLRRWMKIFGNNGSNFWLTMKFDGEVKFWKFWTQKSCISSNFANVDAIFTHYYFKRVDRWVTYKQFLEHVRKHLKTQWVWLSSFEAFLDIMFIFVSVQPQSESTSLFLSIITFWKTAIFGAP